MYHIDRYCESSKARLPEAINPLHTCIDREDRLSAFSNPSVCLDRLCLCLIRATMPGIPGLPSRLYFLSDSYPGLSGFHKNTL